MSEHHHHTITRSNITGSLWAGIILNAAFVIIELIAGIYNDSLALISDAGHNLSDVAGMALSLFAFKMAQAGTSEKFTYGYHKGTILASLANAVILLIAVGSIGWEAFQRFLHPVETQGKIISLVAGAGIIINSISAFIFFKNKESDLNLKAAYLHLVSDAIVSVMVVLAGIIISYTGLKWVDPLTSLLVIAVILYATWKLLVESFHLSLDAVPQNVDMEEIKTEVLKTSGVKDIHHIHIWAMSTAKNAMTAHILIEENYNEKQVEDLKHNIKHNLQHLNIHHVTLETEFRYSPDEVC